MRAIAIVPLLLLVLVAPSSAQTVIWTTDPGYGAAAAAGSLVDALIKEWEHSRTTPMTHRKAGLRPAQGEEVLVGPGEVIVAWVPFDVSYAARPREDFVSARGVPFSSDDIRLVRMLTNRWCLAGGKHCFEDKDNDKDWDGAAGGGRVDVPYEVFELRKEILDLERRELVLSSPEGPSIEYRAYFAGTLATKEPCVTREDGLIFCRGLAVRLLGREGDAARFRIDDVPSAARR